MIVKSIGQNEIGQEGAIALAECLKSNTCLLDLDLCKYSNNIKGQKKLKVKVRKLSEKL